MQHPDEGTIHAWLDGELSAEETAALESHIAECADCSAKVAEARGLIAASSRIVSALDIVPAGVIPAAPKAVKRQWYSSVQFRAAAGFLVVIGASALLFSRGQQKAARETLSVAQPVMTEAPARSDSVAAPEAGAVAADAVKPKVSPAAPKSLPQARPLQAKAQEKVIDATAAVAAPMSASAPSIASPIAPTANEVSRARSAAAEKQAGLNSVVVTGASTAAERDEAAPALKILKSDTTTVTVRNVYEVRQGVEVTLVETTLPKKNFGAEAARRDRQAQPLASASAPPPPQARAMEVATNSITWSKGDKVFTLSGPVSKSELELIRLRLPEDKR